jgi:ABC-2 type transport system permease protein
MSRALATSERVLRQLRHDPRTVALLLAVPPVLMSLLRLIYDRRGAEFDAVGAPLLSLFPLFTNVSGDLGSDPARAHHGDAGATANHAVAQARAVGGYGLAFGLAAIVQATLAAAVALGPLGLRVAGGPALVIVVCVAVALLGMGLGLLASAFARSEFQVVQFFPATIAAAAAVRIAGPPGADGAGAAPDIRRDAHVLCG